MLQNITITRSPLWLLLATVLLTACGGGGGGDDTTAQSPDYGSGSGSGGFIPKNPSDDGDGGGGVPEPPEQDDIIVTEGNITVFIPGRSLLAPIDVAINTTSLPALLPAGFSRVGLVAEVIISNADQEHLNGPAIVTIDYTGQSVNVASNLVVMGYNGTEYKPLTILDRDLQANTITFDSRGIFTFVLAENNGGVPAVFDTGFMPSLNGWNIANFGTYFSPGGNSFGMSGWAAWIFSNTNELLNGLYLDDVARITAARVQMSQAETWGNQSWRTGQSLEDADLALLLKTYLATFVDEPLVLHLGVNSPTLAVTVYGYDSGGFFFYDPNIPGDAQYITYNGSTFGSYGSLTVLGYSALATFGRNSDFIALANEAEAGYPGSENIAIDTPTDGQQIDTRETTLSGSFMNGLSVEQYLYVEVKGIGRQLPVTNGIFSNSIEISHGNNTIVALAGVDASVENNWYKNAPTAILEVEGTMPPAQLLVTLTWEQATTDVDLYITEPDGETMWYGNPLTTNGLELDFDDTNGFGPEHGTLETGGANQVLQGNYKVRVHYFSDAGLNVGATGRVSIVTNESAVDQNYQSFRFSIDNSDSSEDGPDGSGSSWVDIANVDVLNNTIDRVLTAQ